MRYAIAGLRAKPMDEMDEARLWRALYEPQDGPRYLSHLHDRPMTLERTLRRRAWRHAFGLAVDY